MSNKRALNLIWQAGVERVNGHVATLNAIRETSISKPDAIIAIGKAATPMLEAALSFAGYDTNSILITKKDHVICHHEVNKARIEEYQEDGTLKVIEAGHPVPDQNSLRAGDELIKFIEFLPKDEHLLILVSGGASALAEALPEDMDLKQLQDRTDEMLAAGQDIAQINQVRKEFSLIKGGKLLKDVELEQITVFAISDVQGDHINTIGSGIGNTELAAPTTDTKTLIIASNKLAREASEQKAHLMGFQICHNEENAYGNVADVAEMIFKTVSQGDEGVYIFGGEPTVELPDNPGKGGRNQHLALLLAQKFSGMDKVELLVAGTDGSDGPGTSAGGYVNSSMTTEYEGAQDALSKADSGTFLETSEQIFETGPTGTNVMDLIIAIKDY